MAVGVPSSQSLLVQVGARYRDQDHDRASSLEELKAPGMNYLTNRAAPPDQCSVPNADSQWNFGSYLRCRAFNL